MTARVIIATCISTDADAEPLIPWTWSTQGVGLWARSTDWESHQDRMRRAESSGFCSPTSRNTFPSLTSYCSKFLNMFHTTEFAEKTLKIRIIHRISDSWKKAPKTAFALLIHPNTNKKSTSVKAQKSC